MRRLIAASFAVILLMLFTVAPSSAGGPPAYGKSTLALSGRIMSVAADDMDGDGLKDLVVASLKGDKPDTARRTIDIFLQDKNGSFPSKPDYSWPVASSAAVFDTGYADGSGRRSVLFIAPDGVYAYSPENSGYAKRPVRVIKTSSVFTGADPLDLPHYDFYVERPGAQPMALVPDMAGLTVYLRSGGGFSQGSRAEFPVATGFKGGMSNGDGLTVSHNLPEVFVMGFGSPGASDIIAAWDDNAVIFIKKPDGFYDPRPSVRFTPGLMSRMDKDPMEGARLYPADFDGDGRLDLAVVKKTGGIARTKSLVFIYIRKGGPFPAKPNYTIITEGVVGPRFVDLNGDKRLDVMLPSVKVGISNFVNMLTSGKVNVDVDIYLQGKDGSFPERPTKTKSVGFKLDLSDITRAAPVLETGTFTPGGSGLAVVSGDDRVSVYLPDRYSILSDRPGVELVADAPKGMDVEDLNGDSAGDFVLGYKGTANAATINVFLSKPR